MATKTAALAEKARRAKEAKLKGNVDSLTQGSRDLGVLPANDPQASGSGVGSDGSIEGDPVPGQAAVAANNRVGIGSAFSGLSRGHITMEHDGVDGPEDADTGLAPAGPGRSPPVVGAQPARATAPPARSPAAFASLSRANRERQDGPRNPGAARAIGARAEPDPPWEYPELPAGSLCSPQEWADARAIDPGHCVFEFRNGGQSALLTVPRAPLGVVQRQIHDKKVSDVYVPPNPQDLQGKLSWLFAAMWDGCLILSPSATTTHPGAIAGEICVSTGDPVLGDMTYRIVRPASHKDNESLAWLHGIRSVGAFDISLVGCPIKSAATVDESGGGAEIERERSRG